MKDPKLYLGDWSKFKAYCEQRAKIANCHINNKGWNKLREFHLSNFLKGLENPYGFLFSIRFTHRKIFKEVKCMSKYYRKYSIKRQELFDTRSKSVVEFPSWRKK